MEEADGNKFCPAIDAGRPRRGSARNDHSQRSRRVGRPGGLCRLIPACRRRPQGPGAAAPGLFFPPISLGKKWGRPPRRRAPRGHPRRVGGRRPLIRPCGPPSPRGGRLRADDIRPYGVGGGGARAGDHRSPLRSGGKARERPRGPPSGQSLPPLEGRGRSFTPLLQMPRGC